MWFRAVGTDELQQPVPPSCRARLSVTFLGDGLKKRLRNCGIQSTDSLMSSFSSMKYTNMQQEGFARIIGLLVKPLCMPLPKSRY